MDINKVIAIVRKNMREQVVAGAPTNNAGGGNIAGLPPDQPPVNLKKKKKRKPTPVGRYGTRRVWLQNGKS